LKHWAVTPDAHQAGLAQLVERQFCKLDVAGSIPATGTIFCRRVLPHPPIRTIRHLPQERALPRVQIHEILGWAAACARPLDESTSIILASSSKIKPWRRAAGLYQIVRKAVVGEIMAYETSDRQPILKSRSDRNQWIETLRIIAAFGIVWFHAAAPGYSIAYAGLVVFLVLSSYFETLRTSTAINAGSLLIRLGVPWLFWMAVFGAVRLGRHLPLVPTELGFVSGLLYGTKAHLWFMPYLLASTLTLRVLRRTRIWSVLPVVAFVLSLIALATVSVWRPGSLSAGPPWAQYAQALTPTLFGIILIRSQGMARWMTVVVLAAMLGIAFLPFSGVGIPYFIGCGAVMAALIAQAWTPLRTTIPSRISTLLLGVYLIHPAILILTRPLTMRFALAGVTLTFLLSLGIVWAMRRFGGRFGRSVTGN
jgi:surface polysaccharide O-acyltransferase-like enzyme